MVPVHVECYSGHTYAQEPRVIVWRGFRANVARVESTWRTPEGPGFRVRLDSGVLLNLQFIEASGKWLISDSAPISLED